MKKLLLLVVATALIGCATMNDVGRHLVLADSANGDSDQGISTEAKQQIDQANASVTKLQSDLQLAQQTASQVSDLQKQLAAYKSIGTSLEIKTKLDQVAKLESELQLTQKESNDRGVLLGVQLKKAEVSLDAAQIEIQKQRAQLADITLNLQKMQQLAGRVPELEQRLADFRTMGTPQQIRARLLQLAKLQATEPGRIPGLPGVAPGGAPTAPGIDPTTGLPFPGSGGTGALPLGPKQVGKIVNHDPQLDFYVINAGSDNGIKKGDKLTVYRENKAAGKIEITRVQPTVSIAVLQKGFPRPSAPFKPGDKVMKIK